MKSSVTQRRPQRHQRTWKSSTEVHTCHPSTWEVETGGSEFKVILYQLVSFRPVWAIYVSQKQNTQISSGKTGHEPRCSEGTRESVQRREGSCPVMHKDMYIYLLLNQSPFFLFPRPLSTLFPSPAHPSILHAGIQAGVRNMAEDYQCRH